MQSDNNKRKADDRRGDVSLASIARLAGCSKNSVSLALRGSPQISKETHARIKAIAAKLGYKADPEVSRAMAMIRRARGARFQGKLALLNGNAAANALEPGRVGADYVAGCMKWAESAGYYFDRFWMNEPGMSGVRWMQVLETRGIRGIILVGLIGQNRLPQEMMPVWNRFPTVVVGGGTMDPALPFVSVDYHDLVMNAFERVRSLGFERPGMVLDASIDRLFEHRYLAAYLAGQHLHAAPPFVPMFQDYLGMGEDPSELGNWIREHRPDVLFTVHDRLLENLKLLNVRVPDELSVVHLGWRPEHAEYAGLDQQRGLTGEAAVEKLVKMINVDQQGIPAHPPSVMIKPTWVDGPSLARRRV